MDAFGAKLADKEYLAVDYMDQSAFDEKFEIDLEHDYIQNIFHVENKYHVPILAGGYREMYLYSKDNLIYQEDKGYDDLMDPDTMAERLRTSETPGMIKAEFREKLVDGTYRWVQYIGITGVENGVPDGKVYFYVYDIQNQKDRMEGRSATMHSHDSRNPLTGLRVRETFTPMAINLAKSESGRWCCLAIDIQHFKIFNSWFGHEKGDYLLCRIGAYLLNIEKTEKAIASYFGHDNFALILRHNEKQIEKIYNDIREIVNSFSKMVGFLPAVGVYLLEDGTLPGLDIYDKARLAVEEAKKSYTERIKYFDSQTYIRTRANYELLTDFQNALENNEINFFVQPQCSISTGKILGAEALARWIKKDGTVISPGVFVPLLESSGFITELDKHIWKCVCRWLRSLIDRNISPLPVSVNISQADLLSMDVSAYLYALTEGYNIPPRLLKVEITESAYAENFDIISQTVSELRKRGFSVLLDDFGSGYSSLNMLDKINANVLKLDMGFMKKDSSLSKKGVSIVESILGMTKALEVPIIVEGVETPDQIKFLNNLGCRYAQGYYFYQPMRVDEFEQLLQDESRIDFAGFRSNSVQRFQATEFLNENVFTESMLNHVLGAVAYYTLEGKDLTITRFNEAFYRAIADMKMENRITAIQNYVVNADWPMLYDALQNAENNAAEGGSCEVRFYKSDGSVFWFHMHFFHLKSDEDRKYYFGKVEDISEIREQSLRFLEVLRLQADVTLKMDLDRNIIQYITGTNTLYQIDLPSIQLDVSVQQTAEKRIVSDADRNAFIAFFKSERLKEAYRKAIYHEELTVDFIMDKHPEPVVFSTYYIRHSKDQNLTVYAFAKRKKSDRKNGSII
ncbi:MAG: EAL domain-containing protein [Clostridia bacterium]|nr:EAL domain-containing protein [Clostridia bacterium]